MPNTQKTKQQIMAERAASAKRKPAPVRPKEQIMAERAAAAKKKPAPLKPKVNRSNAVPAPLGTPPARPTGRRPVMPKTTKKAPAPVTKKQEKMTPQDAAMKKILEKRYGKIYG